MSSTFKGMGRTFLGVLLALALLPSTVGATTVTDPEGNIAQPFQKWADQIAQKGLPTPVAVTVDLIGCPDNPAADGCVFPGTRHIYLCPWKCNPEFKRQAFFHEVGHVVVSGLPPVVLAVFQRIMRDPLPCLQGPNPVCEKIGEGFRLCANNPLRLPNNFSTQYGYDPTPRQHRQVCRLFQRHSHDLQPLLPLDPTPTQPTTG